MKNSAAGKSQSYSTLHSKKATEKPSAQNEESSGSTLGKPNHAVTDQSAFTSTYKGSQTPSHSNEEVLKANFKAIQDLKVNSPTYKGSNPITEGDINNVKSPKNTRADNPNFKGSNPITEGDINNVKSPKSTRADNPNFKGSNPITEGDITSIKSPKNSKGETKITESVSDLGPAQAKIWRPSVNCLKRKVEQKESSHYEVFGKRGLKQTQVYSGSTSSENPLLGQPEKLVKTRSSGTGDQKISEEYQKVADRKGLVSAQSESRNQWGKYKQSSIFSETVTDKPVVRESTEGLANKYRGGETKNLIGYNYGLPDKQKPLTDKVNRVTSNNFVTYDQVNDCDFRKRSNVLKKEENSAFDGSRRVQTQPSSQLW